MDRALPDPHPSAQDDTAAALDADLAEYEAQAEARLICWKAMLRDDPDEPPRRRILIDRTESRFRGPF